MKYYQVPNYPRWGVSKCGAMYDYNTSSARVLTYNSAGYLGVGYKEDNKRLTLHVHHAMGLTFVPGKTDTKCIINHIDGDKHNNTIPNLEWASYSDNITHAYVNGLRSNNIKCFTTNKETDAKIYYYSIGECSRCVNVNASIIYRYIDTDKVYEGLTFTSIPVSREFTCWGRDIVTSEYWLAYTYSELATKMGISGSYARVGILSNSPWAVRGYEFGTVPNFRFRTYSSEEIKTFKVATKVTKPIKHTTTSGVVTIYPSLYVYELSNPKPSRPTIAKQLKVTGRMELVNANITYLQY